MAAACEVQRGADGTAEGSLIRFDLGRYQGVVILHLAVWNGEFFMSYESRGIAMPPLERNGQSATVRVVTDPGGRGFCWIAFRRRRICGVCGLSYRRRLTPPDAYPRGLGRPRPAIPLRVGGGGRKV